MIERAAPEPMAAYVVALQIMDPAGAATFWTCLFAFNLQDAARQLEGQGSRLADGYTIRDAFIAPAPVRIPLPRTRPMGVA